MLLNYHCLRTKPGLRVRKVALLLDACDDFSFRLCYLADQSFLLLFLFICVRRGSVWIELIVAEIEN